MPKAAVYEDRHPLRDKSKIGSAKLTQIMAQDPAADASAGQLRSEPSFSGPVATPLVAAHHARSRSFVQNVHYFA
jgi:hypothetical protein